MVVVVAMAETYGLGGEAEQQEYQEASRAPGRTKALPYTKLAWQCQDHAPAMYVHYLHVGAS